jgi:peptidoglycan/LPS O-acetylase OafA/YrhL
MSRTAAFAVAALCAVACVLCLFTPASDSGPFYLVAILSGLMAVLCLVQGLRTPR